MVASSAVKREYGTKEDEPSTERVWADGFHYVTARSRLKRFFESYEPFIYTVHHVSQNTSKQRKQ
jgi:hypothetical protein